MINNQQLTLKISLETQKSSLILILNKLDMSREDKIFSDEMEVLNENMKLKTHIKRLEERIYTLKMKMQNK